MKLEHWFTFAIVIVIALCLGFGAGLVSSKDVLIEASTLLDRTDALLAKENDVCLALRGQFKA